MTCVWWKAAYGLQTRGEKVRESLAGLQWLDPRTGGKGRETGYERCRGWEGSGLWGQSPLFAAAIKEYIVLSNPGNQAGQEDAFCVFPLPPAPGGPNQQDNSLNIQLNLFSVSCQQPRSPECLLGFILSSAACWLAALLMPHKRTSFVSCREQDIWASGRVTTSAGLQSYRNRGRDPQGASERPLGPKKGRDAIG